MRKTLVVLLAGLALAVHAAESGEQEFIKKVLDVHAKLQTVQVDAAVNVTADRIKGSQTSSMLVSRPDHLIWRRHAELDSGPLDVSVVADGTNLTWYRSDKNSYVQQPFKDDVIKLAGMQPPLGLQSLVLALMTGNPAALEGVHIKSLTPDADGEVLMEIETHPAAGPPETEQIYADAQTGWLRRLVSVRQGKPMASATITYSRVGEAMGPELFKFVPPPGAHEEKPPK